MKRRLAAIAVTAVGAVAGRASADPALTWRAPAGCPDEAALRTAIESRLDTPLAATDLAIEIEVTAGASGFTARIAGQGAPDARTLASASCAELTDAVALVIARLVIESRHPILPAPPPAPPPVVTPPPPPRPTITPAAWDGGAAATLVVGSGGAPGFGEAAELAAWIARGSAAIELAGQRWRSSTAHVDGTTAGVEIMLATAVLRAGWRGRLLRAWLTGELGTVDGTGRGLDAPRSGSARWVAAGAGAGAAVRIASHLRAIARLEAEVAFDRASFTASGITVYRSPPVLVHGLAGIEITWR